jgi:protein involved in polysaccharide export with SLBB domain
MSTSRLLTLLLVLGAGACRSPDEGKPPLLTEPNVEHRESRPVSPEIEAWFRGTTAAAGVRIMSGDRISISVKGHDDLGVVRDVPPNGDVRVLRANNSVKVVKALGMTPQDLETAVAAVHAADLENPYVTVQIDVAAPRSIFVLGAVKAPNAYAVSENGRLTVVQALALAGGTIERADLSGVTIQRVYTKTGETVSSPPLDILSVMESQDQRDNLVVEPGDTIVVPERPDAMVQVLGHVEKPGSFTWRKGMRLSEAIASAGSFAKFAKKSAIRIVRNGRESILVDYDEVLDGKVPDPELQPGDVIFIDERYL